MQIVPIFLLYVFICVSFTDLKAEVISIKAVSVMESAAFGIACPLSCALGKIFPGIDETTMINITAAYCDDSLIKIESY